MITFFSPVQALHAPEHEFFRGERVACHESPQRAVFVLDALRQRGHALREPDHDAAGVLPRVHSPCYLAFLESAWAQWLALDAANAGRQPFPSVWPVRSLRSDLEPDNFVARLGLYSMDNGTPLSAGTWAAAKAGADAAVSAAALLGAGTRAAFCATSPAIRSRHSSWTATTSCAWVHGWPGWAAQRCSSSKAGMRRRRWAQTPSTCWTVSRAARPDCHDAGEASPVRGLKRRIRAR